MAGGARHRGPRRRLFREQHGPAAAHGGQAVRQARADGFAGVERRSAGSWHCDRFGVEFGPLATTGKYASYRRPSYQLSMGDKRVPLTKNGTGRILIASSSSRTRPPPRAAPARSSGRRIIRASRSSYQLSMGDKRVPLTKNGTGRILIGVVVFPDASTAARCARALLWETDHPRVSFVVGRRQPAIRHRMVTPVTMETHMHKVDGPGDMFPDAGEYDTAFATGRVLAMGLAYTRPTSRIVESDLERIASQIAG